MAGEDYSVKTKVTADVSNFEKGMNKAEKSLKGFSDKLANSIDRLGKKGLVGSMANVTLAVGGLTKSLSTVTRFAKDVGRAVNECTEAYKAQVIAERALDTAISNNPFVTGESSKALKEFASDMQRVTNYGDEELIPMMANLVSLGRDETETMQIMSVALDMSAGMGISLDTAITQLNATLNGSIGRLGQQNKELKGLTEEELKQGKAIDILGKKFKGLASATADTSKQLKNIKGDFKEALGQFTLPSSDMWNKFWAGFYQNGINIINKFNNYLDTQIIGKKILENLESNAKAVSNATGNTVEEVLSDFWYLKEQISYLSDSELNTLKNTLERQKERSEAEERMLTVVKQITNSRKLNLDYERQIAEEEQKKAQTLTEQEERENGIAELKKTHLEKIKEQEAKWKNIENVTGKEVELEEKLKFYQDDLVSIMTEAGGLITTNNQYYKDQMAIINNIKSALGESVDSDWQNKLFDQRLEMLEAERDRAIQYAEEEGKESYSIWREYNEKILEMKLERLEREKNEALNKEGLTEQDKVAIEEYYGNESKKIYDELGEYKKGKGKEEVKDTKRNFSQILAVVQKYAENVKRVFSKITDTVKKVMSGIGNVFKKSMDLFKFNPDTALDSLLAIEDAILTFFVETLPKLPEFFESAIQSIIMLLDTLLNSIDWEKVQSILNSIIDTIIENAPKIINQLLDLVINIAQVLLNGLIHFVESGGWKMLLNTLLTIQKRLEQFVIDNIDEIVQTIIDMLPDLVQFLIDSVVSASKTLAKLIKPIIKLIMAIIEAIFDFLLSDEMLDASIEVVIALIGALAEELLPKIAYLIPKLIVKIIGFAVKNLPKLIKSIIDGLIEGFKKTNWLEVIKQCFMGFIDGFKDLFGIHSPSTLFEGFGFNIVEGLVNGLKGIAEAVNIILEPLYGFIAKIFSGIAETITSIINVSFKGLKDLLDSLLKTIKDLTEISFKGLNDILGTLGKSLTDLTDVSFKGLNDVLGTVGKSLSDITKVSFKGLTDSLDSVGKTLTDITNGSFKGLNDVIGTMNSGLKDLTDVSFKGLKDLLDSSANVIVKITDSVAKLLDSLKGIAEVLPKIPDINLPGLGGGSSGGSGGGTSGGGSLPGLDLPGLPGLPGLGGGSGGGGISDLGGLLGGGGGFDPLAPLEPVIGIIDTIGGFIEEGSSGGGYGKNSTGSTGGDLAVDLLVPGGFLRHFFANGTNSTPSGLALVGEQGPELIKFNGGEQVLNTRNTQKALEGVGGNTNNFNVTFNNLQDTSAFAMMNQLKQYNRQMAINSII